MPTLPQAHVLTLDETGPNVAPLSHMRQGDIFDSVRGPSPRVTIVFGHVGYNQMGSSWCAFRDTNPALKDIDDPFVGVQSPLQLEQDTWLWFVPEGPNHGMSDDELIARLDVILDWAKQRRIKFIVTNGIRDTNHGRDSNLNRASDDRRTSLLTRYLYKRERSNRMQVEVVSRNDVFIRHWTS